MSKGGARMPTFNNMKDLMKAMQKKADQASGNVSLKDLLNDQFIKKHSDFDRAQDFFDKAPFTLDSEDDFEKIEMSVKDGYVRDHFKFQTWDEMITAAGKEHVAKFFK